jgi:hypothetical protein
MNRKLVIRLLAIGIIVVAVITANLMPNLILQAVLIALLFEVGSYFITYLVDAVMTKLDLRLENSQQVSKRILREIYQDLCEHDLTPQRTGRFKFGYESVIYSTKRMALVSEYIKRYERHLTRSDFDENTSYEIALLALFAGYNSDVLNCLERKFHSHSTPEFTRLVDNAGNNTLFQKIVLTLAFGKQFPNRATQLVERIFKSDYKIYYGEWISHATENFQRIAVHTQSDELVASYHVGNSLRPFDTFSRIDKIMKRIDFYFIHPYILSRFGLMKLNAELEAPELIKKEVGFLKSSDGNYNIDYVRKAFQILSNVHEIEEYAKKLPEQKINIYFYTQEIPSVCVQIIRNMGYCLLIPAAIDNAKFLFRFIIEINDKGITEELLRTVDAERLSMTNTSRSLGGMLGKAARKQIFVSPIEEFKIEEGNFNGLYKESIEELTLFLIANNISRREIEMIRSDLLARLSSDANLFKILYDELVRTYDSMISSRKLGETREAD